MISSRTVLAFFLLGATSTAGPAWNTTAPEKAFVFRGTPIHPGCFDSMEVKPGASIDLKACAAAGRTEYGRVERKNGRIAADMLDDGGVRRGFAAYRVLANRGGTFAIQTQIGGGGSGIFDGLEIDEVRGSVMVRKTFIAGGDRCNGGLDSVRMNNGRLQYSSNITPADLIAATAKKNLVAYEDLSSSASSCVATDDAEYDLESGQGRSVSITLTGDGGAPLEDQAGWTERFRYDHCFNAHYNSWFTKGRNVLKGADPDAFGRGFVKACLK